MSAYEGDWEFGKMTGEGMQTFPNGKVFQGKFRGGKFEGLGKTVYNDGTYQEGNYEDGQLVQLVNQPDKVPKNLNDSIE